MDRIFHEGKLVAIRTRGFLKGVHSATAPTEALQLLSHRQSRGHVIKPHRHTPHKRITNMLHEGVVVVRGKIRVDLFGEDKKRFRSFFVNAGGAAIFFGVAHGVRFLADTALYELKNGPYIDDKILL